MKRLRLPDYTPTRRTIITGVLTLALFSTAPLAAEPKASPAAPETDAAQAEKPNDAPPKNAAPKNGEAERLAVWNSPEMHNAYAWLLEYLQTTNRYTPAEARRYVDHLSQLNADQLRTWIAQIERKQLKQLRTRQEAFATQRFQYARARAVQQQQAINQAKLANAQAERNRLAQAQAQLNASQQLSRNAALNRNIAREQSIRDQIDSQNLRTLQILRLIELQELRQDLRAFRSR